MKVPKTIIIEGKRKKITSNNLLLETLSKRVGIKTNVIKEAINLRKNQSFKTLKKKVEALSKWDINKLYKEKAKEIVGGLSSDILKTYKEKEGVDLTKSRKYYDIVEKPTLKKYLNYKKENHLSMGEMKSQVAKEEEVQREVRSGYYRHMQYASEEWEIARQELNEGKITKSELLERAYELRQYGLWVWD